MDKINVSFSPIPFNPFSERHRHAKSNKLCISLYPQPIFFVNFILIELFKNFNKCHVSDYSVSSPTLSFLADVLIDDLLAALSKVVPLCLLLYNQQTILLVF
jgi:hypothetical protein